MMDRADRSGELAGPRCRVAPSWNTRSVTSPPACGSDDARDGYTAAAMSMDGFDSGRLAELVRREYPSPVARPFAFLAAAEEAELPSRTEAMVEALVRYLALVALRGAIAADRAKGAELVNALREPGSKGKWLARLRESLALWEDVAAVAMLGPSDATAKGFSKSHACELLDRTIAARNEAKYRAAALHELRVLLNATLVELWALREHRLLVPREVETQGGGIRRYRTIHYRGYAEPFPQIIVETDLELELGQVYLGRRGSREFLPLAPLFRESVVGDQRDLFVIDRIDRKRCYGRSIVRSEEMAERDSHKAREELDRLLVGFSTAPGWLSASRLTSDDELPAGLKRYAPGEILAGRYRISGYLESGASADVYTARDEQGGAREVALKVLPFELARTATNIAKLTNEVSIAMAVRHENLVTVLDHGLDRGDAFVVLELADGWPVSNDRARDLASYLKLRAENGAGPLGEDDTRVLADALARALGALHAAKILHRDVKPGNVLLFGSSTGGRLRAKLADFGISRAGDALTTTGEGFHVGNCRYLAPERCDPARAREVGETSDIYALGCVLYEALAGRPPFDAPTEREIEAMHRATRPESLHTLRPDVSPALVALIHRSLAKSTARRPKDAREILEALANPTPAVVEDEELETAPGGRAVRRSRRPVLWTAAGALALCVGAAWMGYGREASASDHVERLVQVLCAKHTPTQVHKLLGELTRAVDSQRQELARLPDASKLSTPIVIDIAKGLGERFEQGCVIRGLAELAESRAYPEFDISESLWRLVAAIAKNTSTPRADLVALGRACDKVIEQDGTLRYISAVRALALDAEWRELSVEWIGPRNSPERLERLQALVARCDQVLSPTPPRLRHDFDAYRALALAEIAFEDSTAVDAALQALRAFQAPGYRAARCKDIETVYLEDEVKEQITALDMQRHFAALAQFKLQR
jgi:serine/threonine-protein kinase